MPAVNPSPSSPDTLAPAMAAPVTHYENFPVASLLCPPGLRQPVAVIYAFARIADDNGVYALLLGDCVMVRRVQRRLQGRPGPRE